MSIRVWRIALAVCGLLLSALAGADFSSALGDYNAGHYERARAQFLALAELGDCPSQFNLGAMSLKGEGGPQDRGAAVGWLQAALSNGCREQVGEKVPQLAASLTPEETRAAAAVFGVRGLRPLARSAFRQRLVAIRYSQVRSDARPSYWPSPRQAASRVSCSMSSASCTEPRIR